MTESLLTFLNRTPPVAVRAAAIERERGHYLHKTKRKPLPVLIEESGIPRRTFQRLSYKPDWSGVTIDVASAFCAACGVDILLKRPLYDFVRAHGQKKLGFLTTRQRKAMDKAAEKLVKGNGQ